MFFPEKAGVSRWLPGDISHFTQKYPLCHRSTRPQKFQIPPTSYIFANLAKNHIPIDHDLNILRYWFCIHGFPGHLGKRFLRGIDCGRRYVSLLGPIMGGAGKYCACAVAANGQLGWKEVAEKIPAFSWDDSTRRLFFPKKNNQAFWRKWWLDTLVEHKNNHAIGWLVFWKGKREISQLFASSVIFDHPFPDADCGSGMFTALQTMPRAYCAFLQLPNRWSS